MLEDSLRLATFIRPLCRPYDLLPFVEGRGKSSHPSPLLLALTVASRAPTMAREVTNYSQLGNYIFNVNWGTIINFFVSALTRGSWVSRGLGLLLVEGTF